MKIDQFRNQIVNTIVDYPKKTFIIFLLLNALFIPGLFWIQTDFSYKAWYNDNDPQVKTFQEFEKTFGNDDSISIILKNPKGILNQKSLEGILELTDILWKTNEIVRVDSLSNYQFTIADNDDLRIQDLVPDEGGKEIDLIQLKQNIEKERILKSYLISQDYQTTVVQGFVRPAIDYLPDHSAITQDVKTKVEKFKQKYPFFEIHVTGPVTIVDDFKMATFNDMSLLIPLLYFLFSMMIYFKYRSIPALFFIFSTISFSSLLMLAASGYAGQKINTLTSAAPTILMTIALSDAIHIFSSFFFALKNEFSLKSSIHYSLRKNFWPTLLTSVTTGFGFLSFYTAKVEPVSELGVIVFFGVIFAWLVTYFGLGPSILIFKKYFTQYEIGNKEESSIEHKIIPSKFSLGLSQWIYRYRFIIVALTFVSAISSLSLLSKLKVNMDPMEQFSNDHHAVKANNFLKDNLGYTSNVEMVVDSGTGEGAKDPDFLNKVDEFINWMNNDSTLKKTLSINNIIKSVNQTLNADDPNFYRLPQDRLKVAESLFVYNMGLPQGKDISNFISLDNQKIHLSTQWTLRDSFSSLQKIKQIMEKGKELGLNLVLTGKTLLFHELTPYIVNTFFESFIFALTGITFILMLCLKSVRLGLLALVPNVFPLLIGGGLFYLSGNNIDMGTVIVASVCLGIAVDDSIHFLFEYKKFKNLGKSTMESIQLILTSTYPALLLTTLLISVGFSSFVFGSYIPNIKFGVSVAIILLIALIADFIILPAILFLSDKKSRMLIA